MAVPATCLPFSFCALTVTRTDATRTSGSPETTPSTTAMRPAYGVSEFAASLRNKNSIRKINSVANASNGSRYLSEGGVDGIIHQLVGALIFFSIHMGK